MAVQVVHERILDVSLLSCEGSEGSGYIKVAILSCTHDELRKVTQFQLKNSFLDKTPPELFADGSRELSSDFIQRKVAVIPEHILELITLQDDVGFSFLDTKLVQFCLPIAHHEVVQMSAFYEGHDLKGAKIVPSFHRKWLASVAQDGKLVLRFVENPNGTATCTPHNYKQGGCYSVVFTRDSRSLLTIGDTGFITCWRIILSSFGTQKSVEAAGYFRNVMRTMEPNQTNEDAFMASLPPFTSMESQPEKTWLMMVKEEAQRAEDELYYKSKEELRNKIGGIRKKLLNMISANEELPELEKLGRQEFILDTEEYRRMLVEEQIQVQQVREEVELFILATRYLREQVKQECWDKMAVKGKTVKGFQGSLEVSNYPMIVRSKEQMEELERVTYLARINAVDRKLRKETGKELKQSLQPQRQDEMYEDEDYIGNLKPKPMQASETDDQGDPDALTGSRRAVHGVECNLLASQFELHSPVYKRHQIVLLEDCICHIKECFNKGFDEVVLLKVNEIANFRERNVRISKIVSQLKLEEFLVQPSLSDSEQPEKILTVEDSEITIEKYISHEEKKRLEEQARREEERRLLSMGDNPRERALDMMMGGRLEVNVEEDLFKDMQKPDFMSKDPADISEDELRMAREFEKKEEAFLEEREKMKKALETELRKLQSSITQGMEQYDDRLQKLFQLKIDTQTTIHQEELKILHLACSLFTEKEVKMKEEELNNILEDRKIKKVQFGSIISNCKRKMEEVKENYELQAAEDKEIDKLFKKEFADCEPYVDLLYKFFRKRPRGHRPSICAPSMRRKDSRFRGAPRVSVVEIDHTFHMPEGLDVSTWDRLVAYRQRKMESESKMRATTLEVAEINASLQTKQVEEDRVQQDIQNTFKELSKLQEDKMVFELNLEIQFLLKQGQVEVNMGDFVPDFSDAVLIHRSQIEELNSQIKTLGEAKINSMLECKDFKRGIRMLEWERQKMQLEADDLQEQGKDIQQLRVTKGLLQRLMEKDLLSKDAKQKETLDRTLELNRTSLHRTLAEKRKALWDLDKQVKASKQDNKEVDQRLRKLQVSVAERHILEELAGVPRSEANREQKMKEIVTRRRLLEKIKSQDVEYADLKMEIERLHMKSFPALVQMK